MTRRERLMATLRGEPVDRPAVSFYEIGGFSIDRHDPDAYNIYNASSWQPLLDLAEAHTDIIRLVSPVRAQSHLSWAGSDTADIRKQYVLEKTWEEGASRFTRLTYSVAGRTLTSLTRRDRDLDTVWVVDHLLKEREDVEAYLALPDEIFAEVLNIERMKEEEARLGDSGIVMVDTEDPVCAVAGLFDVADFPVFALTEQTLCHKLLEKHAAIIHRRTERAAKEFPGRLWRIYGPEYVTEPFLPPYLFEEYVVKYTGPMVRQIKSHGGFARIHSHGRIAKVLEMIVEMGADAIDPIEPPPQGDVQLKDVRERHGKQLVLFGNIEISDLENLPAEKFKPLVQRAVAEGTCGEGRGFVLMTTAAPYGREISAQTIRNYEIMVEAVASRGVIPVTCMHSFSFRPCRGGMPVGDDMKSPLNRREMLKTLGMATAGATLSQSALASLMSRPVEVEPRPLFPPPDRPVTAVVAGAGNRGNVYSAYSLKWPSELKIVGVAEPIPFRRERFVKQYSIDPRYVFTTWEDIFKVPRFADVVIITTPDRLHYGPAMAGLEKGYDLLLEKAIAQSWKECTDILHLAQKNNRIVAICHELRYAPFFKKIKDVIDSGALGRLVSIQWLEPVEHIHMSHSFVRGNWRNTAESNPMLLSKSCHDLDLLSWYVGKPCERVSSFGSLTWFRKENAPVGSPARCIEGCPVEANCCYSALKVYSSPSGWAHVLDLPAEGDKKAIILEKLKESPYGRCVYRCDNDVVDHQVVNMEFAGGITASFSMEGHTSYGGRRMRIMGTDGDLVGDENDLFISNFKTGETARWNVNEHADMSSGHGGGDYALLAAFIQAVGKQDPGLLSTTIASAMESHLIGFKAEEARAKGTVVDVGAVS